MENQRVLSPKVDILESKSGIEIYLDVPGVVADNLELSVSEKKLKLFAPVTASGELSGASQTVYRREFQLAPDLDSDAIEAECRDGVLKIVVPHRVAKGSRKIEVRVN